MSPLPLIVVLSLVGFPALADPCTGKLPKPGEGFSGVVRYVGDGDSLCVAPGNQGDPATWIEVRLADFRAIELNQPGGREAKQALAKITKGRKLSCRAINRTWDRIAAQCYLNNNRIGDLMRRENVPEGGR